MTVHIVIKQSIGPRPIAIVQVWNDGSYCNKTKHWSSAHCDSSSLEQWFTTLSLGGWGALARNYQN